MPENAGGTSPATVNRRLEPGLRLEMGAGTVITCARLPRAVGDAVVAVEPLRHGLGNAATGGICRVRGPEGSAILKVARLPDTADPAKAFPAGDEPDHWNYWRREPLAYETGLAATAYADAGCRRPRPARGQCPRRRGRGAVAGRHRRDRGLGMAGAAAGPLRHHPRAALNPFWTERAMVHALAPPSRPAASASPVSLLGRALDRAVQD